VRQTLQISERRACRTLGQNRSTQRKVPCGSADEERLTADIIELTREFGRVLSDECEPVSVTPAPRID
jgi:hypothetical protein